MSALILINSWTRGLQLVLDMDLFDIYIPVISILFSLHFYAYMNLYLSYSTQVKHLVEPFHDALCLRTGNPQLKDINSSLSKPSAISTPVSISLLSTHLNSTVG